MKVLLFSATLIIFVALFFLSKDAQAQVVSVLIDSEKDEHVVTMENAFKKNLQAEGYEVKGEKTGEGFFLYVQFMPITSVNQQQQLRGYAGNLFIGSQAWTKVVDSFMPSDCHVATYQKLKNHVGIEMVLLDSQIFTDSSVERLAESMTIRANTIIKAKSQEMTTVMGKLASQ